jgi:hypothetical protein
MSNIKNMDAYIESIVDWSYLNDCFDRGIQVTDIDGIVEANGHFLMLEAKPATKPVGYGQRKMFGQFASMEKCFVLILWGDPLSHYRLMGIGDEDRVPCTQREVKTLVAEWFEWVENN